MSISLVRGVTSTFSSLGVRNFRLFFAGQLISLTGTWMQSVAQMWLVLHLTGSGTALGITAALQFTPILLFGTWGGLVADRADKRRLLMLTQAAAGCLALTLATLTLGGEVRLWMVYVLAFALGCVNLVDNPTRQSFVTEMVGPARLANAVSLNSATFTAARVIGPAVAGLLIAWVGTGYCFLYNGFSYLPVVAALALMRPQELVRGRPVLKAKGQIKEGLRYAWERPELRIPLLLMLAVGALGFNFSVLLPLMARYVFQSGPETFGLMMSMMGAGAFAGALASARRERPSHRLVALAALGFGTMLLGAALMPALVPELAVLVPLGFAMITLQTSCNSLLQLSSEPSFRGRVMSLYVIVFVGTTPIGGPLVGAVAQHFGARSGFLLGGAVTIAAAVWALWAIRPGYARARGRPTGQATPVPPSPQ